MDKFIVLAIFIGYLVTMGALLLFRFLYRPGASAALEAPPNAPPSRNGVLIELVDVHKGFDLPVLRGISLKIRRGETVGVLGKSGTGKSVLLKLCVGLLRPDQGEVLFEGKELGRMSESELLQVRKQVSYVFQSGAVFDFLDVRGNIAYPLIEQGVTDENQIHSRVHYLLDAVELRGMGDLRPEELSTGSKKQAAIARAIANNPKAILYDEPTTGVDPIIGKSLSRLIRKLNQQEHLTSIVVTHDLKCIEMVADRIILIKDGHIHFDGDQESFHASRDAFIQAFIAGKRFEEKPEAEEEALAGPQERRIPVP